VQRFVGDKHHLRQLNDKLRDLSNTFLDDPETQKFWDEWRNWSDNIIQHPEQVNENTSQEGHRLLDQSIRILKGKYDDDLDAVFNEWSAVLETIQNDELNKRLATQMKSLRGACSGSPLQTLTQVRHLVGPLLKGFLQDLPLPDVVGNTDSSKFSFTQMQLSGKELNLDDCVLKLKIGMKDSLKMKLWMKNINIQIDNVHFEYHRTSIPSFSDEGVCSVRLQGPKWYIKFVVKETKDDIPQFQVDDVSCKFKTFVHIEEARHPMLDNIVLALFSGNIRQRVENTVKEKLHQQGSILANKFNAFFSEEKRNELNPLEEMLGTGLGASSEATNPSDANTSSLSRANE
jgi:hypothetical protein